MCSFTSIDKVIFFYKEKLSQDPRWAVRGLIRVYQNQTLSEQSKKCNFVHNGIGFTRNDAAFLSSLAEQYNKRKQLSKQQINSLLKIMPKYARQLFNCSIAEGKISKIGKNYIL